MKTKKLSVLFLMVLMSFTLISCGSDDDEEGTPAPTTNNLFSPTFNGNGFVNSGPGNSISLAEVRTRMNNTGGIGGGSFNCDFSGFDDRDGQQFDSLQGNGNSYTVDNRHELEDFEMGNESGTLSFILNDVLSGNISDVREYTPGSFSVGNQYNITRYYQIIQNNGRIYYLSDQVPLFLNPFAWQKIRNFNDNFGGQSIEYNMMVTTCSVF